MKIAYILPSLVNTGPIVVVHNVVKYLKDKTELIDVYYFNETPSKLNFDCNVFHISKSDQIDFDKYDIIHTHTLWSDVYIYKNRRKINKAKIISTLHQDTFMSFTIQFNRVAAFFLGHLWCHVQRGFDGVVTISNQLKDRYNKLFLNKAHTIYNGCSIKENEDVDKEIERQIMDYRDKGWRVLGSYAFISNRKGLNQVIDVLDALPDYVYVIFGEGPYLKNLVDQAEKLGLQERVLFLPYVKAPYIYLKYMDIYMMPSYSEGFGLAMVEAALAKKSIVCSNLPSFHEIFTEKEVSFFELDDKASLIQAIENAYAEIDAKGNLASVRANQFFTAEIMAENHLRYYNTLLTNQSISK